VKPLGICLAYFSDAAFSGNCFFQYESTPSGATGRYTIRNFSCSLCGDNSCNSVSVSVSGAELVSWCLKEPVIQRLDGML